MNYYFHVLSKYAVFHGRARRKEFWWFSLVNLIILIVLSAVDGWMTNSPPFRYGILTLIYALAVIMPSLAVGARRLHDIERTGWWQLIGLIPLVGAIVLIVFYSKDSDSGSNSFGPSPKSILEAGSNDDQYADAWDEIEQGDQDKALWAKLYATHAGDQEKTKAAYLKRRVSQHSEQRKAEAKELQKWITEQRRRKKYDRRDLKALKEEFESGSVVSELWQKATQDANQKGENPELLYRKYRLHELKRLRSSWASKNLGPTTLIFVVIAFVGVGLPSPLGTGVAVVGAFVAVIYGLRWIFSKITNN